MTLSDTFRRTVAPVTALATSTTSTAFRAATAPLAAAAEPAFRACGVPTPDSSLLALAVVAVVMVLVASARGPRRLPLRPVVHVPCNGDPARANRIATSILDDERIHAVMLYSPRCGHCVRQKPLFVSHRSHVRRALIDVTHVSDTVLPYPVTHVPFYMKRDAHGWVPAESLDDALAANNSGESDDDR